MVIAAIGEYGEVAEATKLALLPTFALFTGELTVTPAWQTIADNAQNSRLPGIRFLNFASPLNEFPIKSCAMEAGE
jgi:hypothetical protein